jgi:hypothetical protein
MLTFVCLAISFCVICLLILICYLLTCWLGNKSNKVNCESESISPIYNSDNRYEIN